LSDHDLSAAEAWIDGWQASLQERADEARLLRERLETVTGVGWDRRRLVWVTVAATGALADVVLDERIRRQPVATTRAQILEAAQAAQADLTLKAARITAETIGMHHPTADAIVRSFAQRMSPQGGNDGA